MTKGDKMFKLISWIFRLGINTDWEYIDSEHRIHKKKGRCQVKGSDGGSGTEWKCETFDRLMKEVAWNKKCAERNELEEKLAREKALKFVRERNE